MANYDFMGVSDQQQQVAQQNNQQQTEANRPNQQTPWGSTNWLQGPDGSWTQSTTLNPTLQGTLASQQQQGQQRTDAAGGLIVQAAQNFQTPMDYSGFMAGGDRVNGGNYYNDTATNAVRSKFDLWNNDQFGRDTSSLEQTLRNRGFRPGDEGYDQQLQQLRETQGKLRNSSNLDAILTGGAEGARMQGMDISAGNYNTSQRQSQEAEALRRRNQPLNEANALLEGQQVTMPDMPTFTPASRTETPDMLGAQRLQYEQRQDNKVRDAEMLGQGLDVAGSLFGGDSGGVGGLLGKVGGGIKEGASALLGGGGLSGAASGFMSGFSGPAAAAPVAAAIPGIGGALGTGSGIAGAGAAGTAGAATTGTAAATGAAATGGGGFMSGALAAAPWVAGALAAGLVAANNIPKSSPLDGFKFDPTTGGGWSKPQNFDGTKFSPDELNAFFGPAIQKFNATGDAKAALAALPKPQNARQQTMLKGGAKALFGGTGNPFRQIAKARGFGEGIWNKGNKDKKAMIKSLGG